MGLDPSGVPLRARSLLASMRPERKAVLASVRDRLLRRPPSVASRVGPWLDELRAELAGRVLVVGAAPLSPLVGARIERLDPLGRGDRLRHVGRLDGHVLGDERFDAVVVVADGDDLADMWSDLGHALTEGWRVTAPRGLLAVMVEGAAAGELDAWVARVSPAELAGPLDRRGAGGGTGVGPAVVVARKGAAR